MSAGIPVIQKHEKQRLCQAPPIKWQLDSAKISHTYFSLGKLQKPQLSGFKESYKKNARLILQTRSHEKLPRLPSELKYMNNMVIWPIHILGFLNSLQVLNILWSQKFLNSKLFNVFKEVNSLLLIKPAFIWSKVQQNSNIVKYFYYVI